jgi:ABC-type sugar transport system ATPase subunit
VAQIGSPLELYAQPANRFVASFIGSPGMNFLSMNVIAIDRQDINLSFARRDGTSEGEIVVRTRHTIDDPNSSTLELGIRPQHISIIAADDHNAHLGGDVQLVERLGNLTIVYVDTAAGQIAVECDGDFAIGNGQRVGLVFDTGHAHLFAAGGNAI